MTAEGCPEGVITTTSDLIRVPVLDPLSPISAQDPTVKASGSLDSSGPRLFLGLLVSHDLDTSAERCLGVL